MLWHDRLRCRRSGARSGGGVGGFGCGIGRGAQMMVSYRGMLWNQLEVDYYALATALLPEMKEQSRVDHSRDDNTIANELSATHA